MGLIRGVWAGSIQVGGVNQARPWWMATVQSPVSISWWWNRQSSTPLSWLVLPPSSQDRMWWACVQDTGRSQPGQAQPRSRTSRAVRSGPVNSRRVRPTSRGLAWVSRVTGMRSASQASSRARVGAELGAVGQQGGAGPPGQATGGQGEHDPGLDPAAAGQGRPGEHLAGGFDQGVVAALPDRAGVAVRGAGLGGDRCCLARRGLGALCDR